MPKNPAGKLVYHKNLFNFLISKVILSNICASCGTSVTKIPASFGDIYFVGIP